MPQSLEIQIKTLTPLWTGGVDGTCDRLHVSGIIGSMRYWYEAIVRGVGGYACDPSEGKGCIYKPLDEKKPETTGTKGICAACYLFGTTGWARLFRLSASADATEPLHFRTMNEGNTWWLGKAFDKPDKKIAQQYTIYHPNQYNGLHFVLRGIDCEFSTQQLKALLLFMSQYAGIGAKQQFGFGQFSLADLILPTLSDGQNALKQRASDWLWVHSPIPKESVFDGPHVEAASLNNFFSVHAFLDYSLIKRPVTLPRAFNQGDRRYVPSAFDIKYKGNSDQGGKIVGFRTWLRRNHWGRSQTNAWLGASPRTAKGSIPDDKRSASRLYVGMPMVEGSKNTNDPAESYLVKLYGFVEPSLQCVGQPMIALSGAQLCARYLKEMGGTQIMYATGNEDVTWRNADAIL